MKKLLNLIIIFVVFFSALSITRARDKFPTWFNIKQDYYNTIPQYPIETKAALQALLDSRMVWFNVKTIEEKTEGITDKTHRVIESQSLEKDEEVYYQQELKEDPNARLFRMGFTVKEVQGLIDSIQENEALQARIIEALESIAR